MVKVVAIVALDAFIIMSIVVMVWHLHKPWLGILAFGAILATSALTVIAILN